MHNFHHLSICNQNQSISNLVICHQNTKAIALLFGYKCLIFITFQCALKINQFQFWSFFTNLPSLQPYFLATNASFSSLVNLQAQSINFKFGHLSPKYQGYSLTFWPNLPHFHHLSICNQNQSISIVVLFTTIPRSQPYFLATNASLSSLFNLQSKSVNFKFGHVSPKYQGYSLTFWPDMPYFHHFSLCSQHQSISNLVTSHQDTKAIALLFGQTFLIFITFQSAVTINQFQIWSLFTKIPRLQPYVLATNASFSSLFNLQSKSINFKFGHFLQKYHGYSLTFWPNLPHFHHLSICNQNQSISILVLFTTIPRLQPYFLATNASFSSLFNLQSQSINFNFGHFSPKYQAYSLTVWRRMPHFHHLSICNQHQSILILVICHQNTKAIALLFGKKCIIFITFQSAIKLNQFQFWSCFTIIPRLQPYCLARHASFSSLFNLKSTSINFNFGHLSQIYQGYKLTFWPKMPHFHHLSICNQNQSISNLVNIIKIPRLQPYFVDTNVSVSSLVNL